jgi:hypothetical protein
MANFYFLISQKDPHYGWRAPKLIDRLKMNLKYKIAERLGIWGTFPGSQHFGGVEGCARVSRWD